MNAETLEQLEIKMAFLEHANSELSDVVVRQQRDIDTLREQIAALAARFQALRESDATPRSAEDERPPHY
jgi:SlyX protein